MKPKKQAKPNLYSMPEETARAKCISETTMKTTAKISFHFQWSVQNRTLSTEKERMLFPQNQ